MTISQFSQIIAAATNGKWHPDTSDSDLHKNWHIIPKIPCFIAEIVADRMEFEDAEFCAAARNHAEAFVELWKSANALCEYSGDFEETNGLDLIYKIKDALESLEQIGETK